MQLFEFSKWHIESRALYFSIIQYIYPGTHILILEIEERRRVTLDFYVLSLVFISQQVVLGFYTV